MQVKTTEESHFTHTRMAVIKSQVTSTGKHVEKLESPCLVVVKENRAAAFKIICNFFKILNMGTL